MMKTSSLEDLERQLKVDPEYRRLAERSEPYYRLVVYVMRSKRLKRFNGLVEWLEPALIPLLFYSSCACKWARGTRMNRRDFIRDLCATAFSLMLIEKLHLDWWASRHPEQELKMTVDSASAEHVDWTSIFVLDDAGNFQEFTGDTVWSDAMDLYRKIIALSFGCDPKF